MRKNHILLCLILFVIYFLDALLFHCCCFFNSAFEYDQQLGFGNHFDAVDLPNCFKLNGWLWVHSAISQFFL